MTLKIRPFQVAFGNKFIQPVDQKNTDYNQNQNQSQNSFKKELDKVLTAFSFDEFESSITTEESNSQKSRADFKEHYNIMAAYCDRTDFDL